MSRAFRLAARKLEKSGAIEYEIREGKPSELRLYNLRKFFRKYANQMGVENVSYLMRHTVRGSDPNYKPQDPEFYRELYALEAMPFLRLETATPTETEKTIVELKNQLNEKSQEIKQIKQELANQNGYLSSILTLLYNNKGDFETRENEKLGDDFLELWKKIENERTKNLMAAWNNPEAKLVPYQDIVEALTKELKRIMKPYEEIKQQSADTKEDESV
jgi:DNA-directed RNA polymerase subunit L